MCGDRFCTRPASSKYLAKIFLIPRSVYFFFHDDSNKITSTAVGTLYDTAIYENVDDLKKDTQLVFEGSPTKNLKEFKGKDKDGFEDGYSIREIKVTKVFKDETGKNIDNNKTINLIEPIYTVDNGIVPGKTLIVAEDYSPILESGKYLFFLNWSEEKQAYWIHALYQGKINIDNTYIQEDKVALRNPSFRKLKECVRTKLMKE